MARKSKIKHQTYSGLKNLIGLDLIEISRIAKIYKNRTLWQKWLARVGHPEEIQAAHTITGNQRLCEFWAGRFAAKEAFAKALGTGIGASLAFKDIGFVAGQSEKPELILNRKIKTLFDKSHIKFVDLSISHTQNLAMAAVVLTTKG